MNSASRCYRENPRPDASFPFSLNNELLRTLLSRPWEGACLKKCIGGLYEPVLATVSWHRLQGRRSLLPPEGPARCPSTGVGCTRGRQQLAKSEHQRRPNHYQCLTSLSDEVTDADVAVRHHSLPRQSASQTRPRFQRMEQSRSARASPKSSSHPSPSERPLRW